MKGKLIVIESGSDASGKTTQTKLLYEALKEEGYKVKKIKFPDYESESSALVKMYLKGEFGEKADEINPYAASTFYAVDRYASYKKYWSKFLNDGYIIIADRYTTSNMVHQGSKIENKEERELFINWLEDLEYNKINIPRPDLTLFLNVPIKMSLQLKENREQQIDGDIHENDISHLKASYSNACDIAEKMSWKFVNCINDGKLRTVDDIQKEILLKVKKVL